MSPVGIITGTRHEADCLVADAVTQDFIVKCSGANSAQARILAEALVADGCSALISFGLAGGLDPALRAGTLILAGEVVTENDQKWLAESDLVQNLSDRVEQKKATIATVVGVDHVVTTVEAKLAMLKKTGAVCVDMESHAVASAAEKAGVPWLVIRAIADEADMTLPPVIDGVIDQNGDVKTGSLISGLLKRPGNIADLIRLGRVSKKGFAALRGVAPLFLGGELF